MSEVLVLTSLLIGDQASTAMATAHLVALITGILVSFASCGVLLFGHQFKGMATLLEAMKTLGKCVLATVPDQPTATRCPL